LTLVYINFDDEVKVLILLLPSLPDSCGSIVVVVALQIITSWSV